MARAVQASLGSWSVEHGKFQYILVAALSSIQIERSNI